MNDRFSASSNLMACGGTFWLPFLQRYQQRWPKAELIDLYKLCYQGILGPEHLTHQSSPRELPQEMVRIRLEEVHRFPNRFRGQRKLVKGFGIHEDIFIAGPVEELQGPLADLGLFHPFARAERFIDRRAGAQIPQSAAHKGPAFAGFHVLEFDNLKNFSIIFDGQTRFKVCGADRHDYNLRSRYRSKYTAARTPRAPPAIVRWRGEIRQGGRF